MKISSSLGQKLLEDDLELHSHIWLTMTLVLKQNKILWHYSCNNNVVVCIIKFTNPLKFPGKERSHWREHEAILLGWLKLVQYGYPTKCVILQTHCGTYTPPSTSNTVHDDRPLYLTSTAVVLRFGIGRIYIIYKSQVTLLNGHTSG